MNGSQPVIYMDCRFVVINAVLKEVTQYKVVKRLNLPLLDHPVQGIGHTLPHLLPVATYLKAHPGLN